MAAPPSNHRDSVHLTVSKTCRVQEEAHTVGHSEATSSAAHPKSPQKLCLPPPHPPFTSSLFMLHPLLSTTRSLSSPGSFMRVVLFIFKNGL